MVIAALCLYTQTGKTEFTPELSAAVIIPLVAALAIGVFSLVFEIKLVKYGLFLAALCAWFEFFASQVNYLANVLVSIDGTQISTGFLATAVIGALAWIFSLVSAILQKSEIEPSMFQRQRVRIRSKI